MDVTFAKNDDVAQQCDWRPAMAAKVRALPAAQRIVREWRLLTKDCGRTLVACSGGADSTALVLALASATRDIVVAHVVHDMRLRSDALQDRDAAKQLARALDRPFVEGEAFIAHQPGNAEANAREARYAALATLARSAAANNVATAHHADDQFETMLMGLIRGVGLDGLRGAAPRRQIGVGVTLVRPMLGATRAEAEHICTCAGARWRNDATNTDISRLRAWLRAGPVDAIRHAHPSAANRAARTAGVVREAAQLVRDRALAVFGEEQGWRRQSLRTELRIVLITGLREAHQRLTDGACCDQLNGRLLDDAARAIIDKEGGERRFAFPAGVELLITRNDVAFLRVDALP